MKLLLSLMLLVSVASCVNLSNRGEAKSPLHDSASEKPISIQKSKFFDLFTMKGVDKPSNDSGVLATRYSDSLKLEITSPKYFVITLFRKKDYWYSWEEIDFNKINQSLSKSESWPRRYDRFIFKDCIYEYEQICADNSVYRTLYIKKPNEYTVMDLEVLNIVESNPNIILDTIRNAINNRANIGSLYKVIRNDSIVYVESQKTKYRISYTFPETLIWGLPYGI